MKNFRSTTLAAVLLLFAAPAVAQTAMTMTMPAPVAPSGHYKLDPNHTSITFKINHLGFSHYTGRFDKMDGTLDFDGSEPEKSKLDVTIDANSVDTNNAKLEEELKDDKWFNTIKFPHMTYKATKIERTGPTTGKITGDFTMFGVTHEVVLDTTMVGAGTHPMLKKQDIGFTATGTLKRSMFGLQNLLPMVGDDVSFQIETEFVQAE